MPGGQRDPETHLPWYHSNIFLHLFVTMGTFQACPQMYCMYTTTETTCVYLFCPSCSLFQKVSSRKSRKHSTSSPWALVCLRPWRRPGSTLIASGKHNLSPNWVSNALLKYSKNKSTGLNPYIHQNVDIFDNLNLIRRLQFSYRLNK